MKKPSLISMAILKVNWDHQKKDYIEGFVPFVVELARLSEEDNLKVQYFKLSMSNEFGLDLPHNTLKLVLGRAVKAGYLRKESGRYIKIGAKCGETSFQQDRELILESHKRVIERLQQFAWSIFSKKWSKLEAENVLTEFLANNSLSFLFDSIKPEETPEEKKIERFIVGSFIKDSQERDAELFEDLVLLARGNLLANAMYIPDQGHINKKFRNTAVYLDTTILLYATGFAGPEKAEPCLEFINLLNEFRANIRCFGVTLDEAQNILDTSASRLRSGDPNQQYGQTVEYFIESGKTASDLELMTLRLRQSLSDLGIQVIDHPPFRESTYQIDEQGFEDFLGGYINYSNPRAKVHDVTCISAIARIRRSKKTRDIEDCIAIFVSSNDRLVKTARKYFHSKTHSNTVSLALTDYALANLLWLKNPTSSPSLPRLLVVANAFAATQPPENLWRKYLNEISKLEEEGRVTEEEYYALRHTLTAKAALMGITGGDEDQFSKESVPDIRDKSIEAIQAPLSTELVIEKQHRAEKEGELLKLKREKSRQHAAIRGWADRIAKIISNGLLWITLAMLFLGIYATFPSIYPSIMPNLQSYLAPIGIGVFAVITLLNLAFGATVKDIVVSIDQKISGMVSNLLFLLCGMDTMEKVSLDLEIESRDESS